MKIKELALMAGVNPETIRMYRNMGYLQPEKLKNGYYDYSVKDFATLARLRKFRELGFSLEEIGDLRKQEELSPLLMKLDMTEKRLEEDLKSLHEKIRYIHFEKSHILASQKILEFGKVSLEQSIDEKIDFYQPLEPEEFPIFDTTKNHFFYTTISIFIPKEILNGPVEDKVIHTEIGIGTYKFIFDELNIDVSNRGIHVPNGLSISQVIQLENLNQMNILDLAPMMNYAKKMGKPFLSDTTGYLIDTYYENGKAVYLIRIRACVEENDIIHPDRV